MTSERVTEHGARFIGFELEDSHLEHPDRLERLILIMTLAMYWCVRVGREDALHHPTPLEKTPKNRLTRTIGASESSSAAWCPGSNGDCVA